MAQIPNIKFQIIDNTSNKVEGLLDIANPTSFPVAITYSIKDIQDISKSKGSYSKTFKIPATRNNNEVFKSIFSDSFYNAFEYIEDKEAMIFVDGSLIMQGKFKIKATTQNETPLEYECVVFGENYEWVNALENINLCDIDFDAGNVFPDTPSAVEYDVDAIKDTWKHNFSGHIVGGVGTHIVYPLLNTGKWIYGDFAHMDDLFPAVFIRDIVIASFAGIGYQLQSDFMDTDWFKKLITISPRQIFEQGGDGSVATPNSWEYATDPDNESGWKIPMNYRNLSATPNNFDGAIGFLPNPSCAGCDPDGVMTAGNTIIDAQFQIIGAGFNDENDPKQTICGWYWGQFGELAQATNSYPPALNEISNSYCNTGMWIWGMEWNCVWTDPVNVLVGSAPPVSFHEEPINNVSIIQTAVAGEYSFNIEAIVEMDDDYVINNEPEEFDPYNNAALQPNYNNKGFMYNNADGLSQGWTDPMTGLDEFDRFGMMYCCNIWLVKIDAGNGHHYLTHLDRDCKTAANYGQTGLWGGYFAGWYPDSDLPAQNMQFKVSATNVLVDILDVGDKYYFYTEVFEVVVNEWQENNAGGVKNVSFTQCKYRIIDAQTWGGLTNAINGTTQVTIGSMLPCDVTQLEWINGLTGLFNLYWYADEGAKIIYVEPRDNFFYDQNLAVDWSLKLDMGQNQKSEFVYDSLNRDLCFTYEDDSSDIFVEERNARVGQLCSLNSFAMDLGNLYKNKETRIGTTFYSPTYMFNDPVIATNPDKAPFIPVIHSEFSAIWTHTMNSQYPDKVEEFAPRILLWGGLTPLNLADGAIAGNKWRFGKTNPSDTPEELSTYPFAGTFHSQDHQFFPSLLVGNFTYFPTLPFQDAEANDQNPAAAPPLYPFCDGLFKVFWEKNINGLLDRPRIKRVFMKLTAKDITDFDFRTLVYLDASTGESSTYWIVNKIVDYKPTRNEMTKVELYQWNVDQISEKRYQSKKISNLGQSRDNVTGRNFAQNIRLENFSDSLGISGVSLKNEIAINNPTATNIVPMIRNKENIMNPTDGAMIIQTNNQVPSISIGSENETIKGSGSIIIGNNNLNSVSSGIRIGNNTTSIRNNSEQIIVQGANTKNPAFVVDGSGMFLEGGGGAIVAQDASGNYVEVYAEIGFLNKNYRKILKNR